MLDRLTRPTATSPRTISHVVGSTHQFPPATMVEPADSGYLILALEIDRRPGIGFVIESREKRLALDMLKAMAGKLRTFAQVHEANIFKALFAPPGRGTFLRQRRHVPVARFDVVMLVEFASPQAAREFAGSEEWERIRIEASASARRSLSFTATNSRRMGPVDHDRSGVFLFNWFYADDVEQNLSVWEHTAGWFESRTGLDNSTLLRPDPGSDVPYTLLNHCRWDRLSDILPALLLRPSFRSFVLANFEANKTAAIPILYRLA